MMVKKAFFCTLVLTLIIAGCGGDDESPTETDTTAPTVVSTYPPDQSIDIEVNTVITATFSEDMNPSTIARSTFLISDGITGTVSLNNKTATLTPSTDLEFEHEYTGTITTSVKDEAGNPLSENYTWSFTTVPPVGVSPTVISTYPNPGAIGLPIGAIITATFSKDMDPLTITSSTFFLSDAVIGVVTYSNRTAFLNPLLDLEYNHEYTAFVTTGAKDIDGNPMEITHTWTFTSMPAMIMPLDVGNHWAGQVVVYDTLGAFKYEYKDTIKIVNDTMIASEIWYIDQWGKLYLNRPDGLYNRTDGEENYLFLKYPNNLNDTWAAHPDLDEIVEVLDIDTVLSTPQSTYNCIMFEGRFDNAPNPPTIFYYFYAPEAGLIMWETFYDSWLSPLKLKARWKTLDILIQ